MSVTVFAESMGLFHKGSGGKGVAPADVCLSPPPPPAGPVPIPYINNLSAKDLTKGSKKVKIQGKPTALENASEVSTSIGNEAGTQGGGVVTHKTKGKGSFTLWSFVVKIEGKGVCCHGHMMFQNSACTPPNCVDASAITTMNKKLTKKQKEEECDEEYCDEKHRPPITREQYDHVYGRACWECARDFKKGLQRTKGFKSGYSDPKQMTPDHQPPLKVAWEMGGCNMKPSPEAFKEYMQRRGAVKPHCVYHSKSQGGTMGRMVREEIWEFIK